MAAILEAVDEESYGLAISEELESETGPVYNVLKALKELEFIEQRLEDPEIGEAEGRPQRKLYSLTRLGEHQLARWRAMQIIGSPAARLLG